jgi:hypothetical protein
MLHNTRDGQLPIQTAVGHIAGYCIQQASRRQLDHARRVLRKTLEFSALLPATTKRMARCMPLVSRRVLAALIIARGFAGAGICGIMSAAINFDGPLDTAALVLSSVAILLDLFGLWSSLRSSVSGLRDYRWISFLSGALLVTSASLNAAQALVDSDLQVFGVVSAVWTLLSFAVLNVRDLPIIHRGV